MKYAVKAVALNRKTRKQVGKIRTEVINTKTNSLFRFANTPMGVEKAYERFWNDLNPMSKEIVKVISVTKRK